MEDTLILSGIENGDPARCVQLAHSPSVHVYYALKARIEQSSTPWLREFLEYQGLQVLVDTLEQLADNPDHGFSSFSDAILQLDCISCVKAILNTGVGIKYITQQDDYIQKLVKALNTPNPLAKKHMFELLTAICVFSSQGYSKLMEAFKLYKKLHSHESRFWLLMTELREAETAPYRTSMMALINCIINCTPEVKDRVRVRNEFVALQILEVMCILRKDVAREPDLAVQMQVFQEQKRKDELELCPTQSLDYNSHQDVFYATYQKLLGTPEAIDFLDILQDLYLLDQTHKENPTIWQVISKVVHQVASLRTAADVESFMENLSEVKESEMSKSKQSSLNAKIGKSPLSEEDSHFLKDDIVSGAPGMQKMDRKDSGISVNSCKSTSPYENMKDGIFKRNGSTRGSSRLGRVMEEEKEMNRKGPVPQRPVRPVKWVKVNSEKSKRQVSLWGQIYGRSIMPNYKVLEEQFAEPNRVPDAEDEVELLSTNDSLAVNMFFSRSDYSAEEVIEFIEELDDAHLGLSAIRYLKAILPSNDEIEQMRLYKGERYDLGQAEQFLLMLSDIPDYQALFNGLVFKAEFCSKFQMLQTAFSAMTKACRDLLHHPGFRDFLKLILDTGNFLNAGSPFGNATGVKLSSLHRLSQVKGHDPRSDLLGHLIRSVESQNEEILLFLNDFPYLEKAASHNLESLKQEVTQLNTQLRQLLQDLATANPKLKDKFDPFVEDVKHSLQHLQDQIVRLRNLSQQVALYFCEEDTTFDLQACFKQLLRFCRMVNTARKKQAALHHQYNVADGRRRHLAAKCTEGQEARVFGKQAVACSSFVSQQTDKVIEQLLEAVHSGRISSQMGARLVVTDSDDQTLFLSRIAPQHSPTSMAPQLPTPSAALEELFGFKVPPERTRCTLPDFMENVIGQQYRRGNQMQTASFLDPDNKGKIKELPSPALVFKVPAIPPEGRPTHRRTTSDVNDSCHPVQKWHKYEKRQQQTKQSRPAPIPESKCALASLSLENWGQTLSLEDITTMLDKEEEIKEEKIKKKKSFGFLRRFSRAVLRNRNSDYNVTRNKEIETKKVKVAKQQDIEKEGKKKEKLVAKRPTTLTMVDKENVETYQCNNINTKKVTNKEEKALAIKYYQKYR